MKRTNFLTKLISFLLFGAMIAYLGVYVYRSVTNNIRTAPAVLVEIKDSLSVTGMIVREESVISSSEAYISVSVESGQIMSVGETIAVAYSGEAALERAGRIRELELQRQYIESVLHGSTSDTTLTKRDNSIRGAITALGAAAQQHELDLVSEAAVTLASLVMDNPDIYTTEVDLSLVTEELTRLKQNAANDTKAIAAPIAGLFFSHVDGFEYISPEDIIDVSPTRLGEILNAEQEMPDNAIGKLVDPLAWYYAVIIPFEYAENFEIDESATLDFGRYCSGTVEASVVSMKYYADEECAIVFRCTSSAAEMLYARNVPAEILFGSTKGIRVPKEAVYEEDAEVENTETGESELVIRHYVYTVTGLQAEKKFINIIWENPDYYLAEISQTRADSLREGNDIILTDREIHDGMLLE